MSVERGTQTAGATTARDVERLVLARIAAWRYPPGTRLPTCEALAREIGASKNTVSKAYRSLTRKGYLTSAPRRGTFARPVPELDRRDAAVEEVVQALRSVVEQADLVGLERDALMHLAAGVIEAHFARETLRVGYVDCCEVDAQGLGQALEASIAVPVLPLVLDRVVAELPTVCAQFDILAVNLSHLALVEGALAHWGGTRPDVVAILSLPDPATLMQAARLPAGTRVLLVADVMQTLHMMRGLIGSLNGAIAIETVASDDPGLPNALGEADVILVTRSAQHRVAALEPIAPVIQVRFKLDEQSTTYLADRVAAAFLRRGAASDAVGRTEAAIRAGR
jgi:DNA-binding transcriptional regulator YhcF (GntR family)